MFCAGGSRRAARGGGRDAHRNAASIGGAGLSRPRRQISARTIRSRRTGFGLPIRGEVPRSRMAARCDARPHPSSAVFPAWTGSTSWRSRFEPSTARSQRSARSARGARVFVRGGTLKAGIEELSAKCLRHRLVAARPCVEPNADRPGAVHRDCGPRFTLESQRADESTSYGPRVPDQIHHGDSALVGQLFAEPAGERSRDVGEPIAVTGPTPGARATRVAPVGASGGRAAIASTSSPRPTRLPSGARNSCGGVRPGGAAPKRPVVRPTVSLCSSHLWPPRSLQARSYPSPTRCRHSCSFRRTARRFGQPVQAGLRVRPG